MTRTATLPTLYTLHRAALVRYAERMLGDRSAAAEDVVQEAFLRAHRLAAGEGAPPPGPAWLYTVVRNTAFDELRKHRRVLNDDAMQERAGDGDAASAASLREEVRAVLADVVALPVRQRDALMAHAVDGLPHTVVALRTGTTVGGSKALVNRARSALADARRLRAAA